MEEEEFSPTFMDDVGDNDALPATPHEDVILCEDAINQNMEQYTLSRELSGMRSIGTRKKVVKQLAGRVFPLFNPKKSNECPALQNCDKIFAACWIDNHTAALGTKDNRFFLWDVFHNTYKTIDIPTIGSTIPADACGMHDIDINPSKNLIAAGGHSPLDVLIFNREDMKPTCLLKGHSDWVFSSKFLEDDYLVTASRDSTVSLWKVASKNTEANEDTIPIIAPSITRGEHTTKVRALCYHRGKKQIATVSIDSVVKIWDRTNMDVVASLDFKEKTEMVCMAVDETHDLLAIGCTQGTCVLGPTLVMTVPDSEGNRNWGVRSTEFFHQYLSMGGPFGSLSVYDLRSKSYLGKTELKVGKGWVDTGHSLYPVKIRHAIYSHKFDELNGKVLVAGGPIMAGAKGSYAAVW